MNRPTLEEGAVTSVKMLADGTRLQGYGVQNKADKVADIPCAPQADGAESLPSSGPRSNHAHEAGNRFGAIMLSVTDANAAPLHGDAFSFVTSAMCLDSFERVAAAPNGNPSGRGGEKDNNQVDSVLRKRTCRLN